jgi:hypothetical protein
MRAAWAGPIGPPGRLVNLPVKVPSHRGGRPGLSSVHTPPLDVSQTVLDLVASMDSGGDGRPCSHTYISSRRRAREGRIIDTFTSRSAEELV